MLAWFSKVYIENNSLDIGMMKNKSEQKFSHDNLSHSLLSAFGVKTKVYQSAQDLFIKKHQSASGSG